MRPICFVCPPERVPCFASCPAQPLQTSSVTVAAGHPRWPDGRVSARVVYAKESWVWPICSRFLGTGDISGRWAILRPPPSNVAHSLQFESLESQPADKLGAEKGGRWACRWGFGSAAGGRGWSEPSHSLVETFSLCDVGCEKGWLVLAQPGGPGSDEPVPRKRMSCSSKEAHNGRTLYSW